MMLTRSRAAGRARKDAKAARRSIRTARLRAGKVGTQHTLYEESPKGLRDIEIDVLPLPSVLRRTFWGAPMPNWVAAVRRSRSEH
jgi:hypothetical protein